MTCKHTIEPGSFPITLTLSHVPGACSMCEVEQLRNELAATNAFLHDARLACDHYKAEYSALAALVDLPRTHDFFEAVKTEAAHQIARWGTDHDAGKRREDWITLLTYLLGKASRAHYDVDVDKLKHHIVTVAAVCLNWLRAENGENNAMRPGIGGVALGVGVGP